MTAAPEPRLAPVSWAAEVAEILRRLLVDFADLPAGVVEHVLEDEVLRYEHSRITSYVPILIEKNVRAWLRRVQLES